MSAINQAKIAMDQDIKNKKQAYDAEVRIAELTDSQAKRQAELNQARIKGLDNKLTETNPVWNKLAEISIDDEWELDDNGYVKDPKNQQQKDYNGLKKKRDKIIAERDKIYQEQYGILGGQQGQGGQPTEQDHRSANDAAKASGKNEYELGGRKYRVQ